MTSLLGPLLAVALVAQTQGGMLEGTVVDDRGNPVAGAQVVFRPAPPSVGQGRSCSGGSQDRCGGPLPAHCSSAGSGPHQRHLRLGLSAQAWPSRPSRATECLPL